MGSSSENFCLKWNDFEANVSGAFRDLRAESDFFDVSLVGSDSNKFLQAHKVILSACSSFFKGMLRQQALQFPHQPNACIYLRGVSFSDLSSVLDFMYHGEVNVAQEDLNSFLAVAEELQIKGLTNKEGEASKPPASGGPKSARKTTDGGGGPPVKRRRPSPVPNTSDGGPSSSNSGGAGGSSGASADVKSVVDIKSDPEAGTSQAVTDSFADDTGDFEEYGDYDQDSYGNGGEGAEGYDVNVEGAEDRETGKGHQCNQCDANFDRKSSLIRHLHSVHRENLPIAKVKLRNIAKELPRRL